MIKPWRMFNESKEVFTIEMAQEIGHFIFDEDRPNDDIIEKFYSIPPISLLNIVLYEISYQEILDYIKLIFEVSKNHPEVIKDLIEVYNMIRKRFSSFPHIYEIEDIYLDIIENYGFNFYICMNYKKQEYLINLSSSMSRYGNIGGEYNPVGHDHFFKVSDKIKSNTKRLSKYKTEVYKILYENYENYENLEFKIKLSPKN